MRLKNLIWAQVSLVELIFVAMTIQFSDDTMYLVIGNQTNTLLRIL